MHEKRTCDKPKEDEELVEDKVYAESSFLMGLKRGHIITEPFTPEKEKTKEENLFSLLNFDKFNKENFTNGCQCDKSVINRYRIIPSLEVSEQHCGEEDEDDNRWH